MIINRKEANTMKYYEVIKVHDYINEVLHMTVEAENEKEAREALEKYDYSIIEVDDDFDRIYVK